MQKQVQSSKIQYKSSFFLTDACNSIRFSNKIYYNAHPSDCTKYISCNQLSSGNYLGVVMSCARGRFWNDVALTCDYPWNVKCAHGKYDLLFTVLFV